MTRPTTLVALLLAAVSMAGCGKGDAATADVDAGPSGVADLAFEGETGSVRGTVTDPSSLPIPGALVGLGAGQVVADATGGFLFQNVPVGSHVLRATALGYHSSQRTVDVSAGQEVAADLQLEEAVVEDPFHETVVNAGHVCFQTNFAGQASDGGITLNGGNLACGGTGTIFLPFEVRVGLQTLVAEMEWTPTSSVTAPEFRLLIHQGGQRSGVFTCDYCYGEASGPSPIVLRIDEGVRVGEDTPFAGVDETNRTLEDVIYTPPAANPTMVNLVFDQRTTVYNTMFYGALAPEGFSARPA